MDCIDHNYPYFICIYMLHLWLSLNLLKYEVYFFSCVACFPWKYSCCVKKKKLCRTFLDFFHSDLLRTAAVWLKGVSVPPPTPASSRRTTGWRASVRSPSPASLGSKICEYTAVQKAAAGDAFYRACLFRLCYGTRRAEKDHHPNTWGSGFPGWWRQNILKSEWKTVNKECFFFFFCHILNLYICIFPSFISENVALESIEALAFSDLPELIEM